MTVATLIQLTFAALVVTTGLDWLRHRDRTRWDIWLVFVCLLIPAGLPAVTEQMGAANPLFAILSILAVMVQPLLLLRLVRNFHLVPRRVTALTWLGFFVALALLMVTGDRLPLAATLVLIVYFLAVEAFPLWAFWRVARAAGGVVRRRLRLATAGTVFLALTLVLSGGPNLVPSLGALFRQLSDASTLAAAVCYFLAFSTPRPLRRAWQLDELYRFLRAPAGPPGAGRGVLDQLADAAARTTGGLSSRVWLWEAEPGHFVLRAANPAPAAALAPRAAEGPLGQAWTAQRPVLARQPAEVALAVPIVTAGHAWGVLEVGLRRSSLFPDDDLALLALLADQTAQALEREALSGAERRLLEQLAQTNAELQSEVEERRQAQMKLAHRTEESEALARSLEAVIENIPAMLFMKDAAELRFVRWNKACEEVVGLPRAGVLGQSDRAFFPLDEAEFFIAKDREVLNSGQLLDIPEETIHTAHQGVRVLHTRKVPILGADGRPQYLLGISEDITEQRATEAHIRDLNARLTERAAQLEAANQELEAFSYSVSHDLRAPLRAIDGFSQALLEDYGDQLDATGQNYLQRIRRAAQRMAQLIDDLLSLARVSRTAVHQQVVDISSLARAVLAECQAAEPDRRVDTVVAEGLTTVADARLLRVALENLLGNAWKFTGREPQARIEVGAAQQNGHTVFCVRDNGAGFDMTGVDRLFNAFHRMHTPDEFPGTGIGLAIVDRIIRRHGGRIWAESAPGRGAAFYFVLGGEGGV